jgi:hypothetical protein
MQYGNLIKMLMLALVRNVPLKVWYIYTKTGKMLDLLKR